MDRSSEKQSIRLTRLEERITAGDKAVVLLASQTLATAKEAQAVQGVSIVRLEERWAASEKAVSLQDDKNEVHFRALNGEQARLAAERSNFISREVFEEWRKGIDQRLDEGRGRDKGISQFWGVLLAVAAIAIALFKGHLP